MPSNPHHASAIAIVGLGCRVPGANSPREFWQNLRDGVESVRTLSTQELLAVGADVANPKLVRAAALVSDVDMFDAAFFGIPAREAELMDPQHRLFLECAWETLEDAALDPARYDGAVSVFGGGIFDSYVTLNLLPAGVFDDSAGNLQTVLANEKDYMVSRVAYKLNLRGAALNVQTGCSTSLVAVHLACQSLLNFESDAALAGGVAVDTSRRQGYIYHEGSVFSPDGHCRAFDADARGTVFGNGVAMVALKRLDDAIADGDAIRAIILGTAINNDGSVKVGFTAPSVGGQSQVIAEALSAAGVEPASINYVEAHGTGTQLGDPIEIQAMAKAFAEADLPARSVGIGSVKTNIGHLDAAAGVSGLIKTVLALEHRLMPPTLHFKRANPELELHRTPFTVVAEPRPWTAGSAPGVPRRAGVSSFGIGGTNAHAVVEEAPAPPPADPSRSHQILVLSARSAPAVDTAARRLADHLRHDPATPLPDAAFTLQEGRAIFRHRRAVVCRDVDDAIRQLEAAADGATPSHEFTGEPPRVAFMFPGQGAQYAGMARGLYESEPVFRRAFDECAEVLRPGLDLVQVIKTTGDPAALTPTGIAQPALFAVEYSLAQVWRAWGVEPEALIGHSVGEYVAACIAGVFSMPDALRLVAERGRLMQSRPAGAMTAVPLAPGAMVLSQHPDLDLAAVNAPSLSVVAGPVDAIERFEAAQRSAGIECRRLVTSHAFHSASMDQIVDAFASRVRAVTLRAPQTRFISNLTGTWITDQQATSAEYWAKHLRAPVLFSAGVATLLDHGIDFFVEAGPGRTAVTLAGMQRPGIAVATSLPGATGGVADESVLLAGVARAWMAGAPVDWKAFRGGERRRRVHLPTYPFERQRHWIEPDEEEVERHRARVRANEKRAALNSWTYVRSWHQRPPAGNTSTANGDAAWLVIVDGSPIAQQIVGALSARIPAARLLVGHADADYDALVARATTAAGGVLGIVHLTAVDPAPAPRDAELGRGFFSVAKLGASLARVRPAFATVKVVTSGVDAVSGTETLVPERATIDGVCTVLPQEQGQVQCQRIDVMPAGLTLSRADLEILMDEILAAEPEPRVAVRGGRRWTPAMEPLTGDPVHATPLRQNGHYLVIGGLGTIGFSLAWQLAKDVAARLSIVSRTALPPRESWKSWYDSHPPSDPINSRIGRIIALEQAGSQVLPLSADAADAAAMCKAIADAERTFGPIHGVITAAGLMDEAAFAPIERLDPAAVAAHFRPKLQGLPALAEALGSRPVDFCLVMSSLSAVLGGVGYAMYAGANAYLDAFVQQQNAAQRGRWSSINWDAWHPLEGALPATSLLARLAIYPSEAVQVFDRLLRYRGITQVFVSTADLVARVKFAVPDRVAPAVAAAAAAGADGLPDLAAMTAPADVSPTEAVVIAIWQQTLGAPRVELQDTFLDLGGSSLTAIQVIGRLEAELGVKITIEEFIFQTAAQLAALCDTRRGSAAGGDPEHAVAAPAGAAPSRGWSRIRQALRS